MEETEPKKPEPSPLVNGVKKRKRGRELNALKVFDEGLVDRYDLECLAGFQGYLRAVISAVEQGLLAASRGIAIERLLRIYGGVKGWLPGREAPPSATRIGDDVVLTLKDLDEMPSELKNGFLLYLEGKRTKKNQGGKAP